MSSMLITERDTPMNLAKRITKKLRRRHRVKGTNRFQTPMDNAAKRLIDSYYGMPHTSRRTAPSDANIRANERLVTHRSQWANTPTSNTITRQQIRAQRRKFTAMMVG